MEIWNWYKSCSSYILLINVVIHRQDQNQTNANQ